MKLYNHSNVIESQLRGQIFFVYLGLPLVAENKKDLYKNKCMFVAYIIYSYIRTTLPILTTLKIVFRDIKKV